MTGYAGFDNGELIDYGTIEIGKRSDIYENILHSARSKLLGLINKVNADLVVIEDIQQQNQNVSTYKKLAMLMGVLLPSKKSEWEVQVLLAVPRQIRRSRHQSSDEG
jgi:Holliday junction resolvasome RuvABC endonuclease subunit